MSNVINDNLISQQAVVKKKTKKQRDKERAIVRKWALNKISQGEPNYYYFALDVYNKFKSDTGLGLTIGSFGSYLKHILKKTSLNYINIKKGYGKRIDYKHRAGGNCNYYFGLTIENLTGSYQYFDLKSFKPKYDKNGLNYKIAQLKFDFFNEEKIEKWLNRNFIINLDLEASEVHVSHLFINYSKYYQIEAEPSKNNLKVFGKLLSSYLKKTYPFMKKNIKAVKINESTYTTNWHYKYIRLK